MCVSALFSVTVKRGNTAHGITEKATSQSITSQRYQRSTNDHTKSALLATPLHFYINNIDQNIMNISATFF